MFVSTNFSCCQENKRSGEIVEVLAEKLLISGQSVLTLIAELKRLTLLTDLPALNAMVDAKTAEYEAAKAASEQSLKTLALRRSAVEVCQNTSFRASLKDLHLLAAWWTTRLCVLTGHRSRQGAPSSVQPRSRGAAGIEMTLLLYFCLPAS